VNNDILSTLKKPISVFWEPTEFCNLQCRHCYTNSGPDKKLTVDYTAAKKLVDELHDEGIYAIGIGGGEPLLLPFLCDLIEYINHKGMNVSISTNAVLLSPDYICRLKAVGTKIIQISVDGLKLTHELIRGKGTFEGIFEKINMLQDAGIGVRIGYTINSLNYKEIDSFIEYAKARNVHVINFFRYMPYHENGDYLELSPEQLYEVTKVLMNRKKENNYSGGSDKFYITFEPLSFFSFLIDENEINDTECSAGKSKFIISCDGEISTCNYISKRIGNLSDGLPNIWSRIADEYKQIHKDIPYECKDCKFAEKCRGGCKGFSYAYTKGFGAKDKACFLDLIK